MSGQIRYSDAFKIDAVAQVTERGCSAKEVAERLGISTESLYTWMANFSKPQRQTDQAAEVRRLKTELARITEERDILKKAPEVPLRRIGARTFTDVFPAVTEICDLFSPKKC